MIEALQKAWLREVGSIHTYRELAASEEDEGRRKVLLKLAASEEAHAQRWATRLRELGAEPPPFREGWRDRLWRWLLVQMGTETAIRRLEQVEEQDAAAYDELLAVAETTEDKAAILQVQAEDAGHARILGAGAADQRAGGGPQAILDTILRRERWHRGGGGWIGQAIYGANDGLGAVFGVVSGMAGYTGGSHVVLITGLAAMLASALSMGSGAYLATKSEREVYEAEIARERAEIEENPEEEIEEVSLFYQLKGFSEEEADMLAARLADNPEQMLRTLAHEELGLSTESFPNPWTAALSATLATAVGAFIPVIPFFFATGMPAVVASFLISTLAHFAVGAAKTVITGLSPWRSGLEMTAVGIGEAAITYTLGLFLAPVG
jgi:VIT1/CCC1 family predicted Fe2+/Mn2+ transporter/rubrerythrin